MEKNGSVHGSLSGEANWQFTQNCAISAPHVFRWHDRGKIFRVRYLIRILAEHGYRLVFGSVRGVSVVCSHRFYGTTQFTFDDGWAKTTFSDGSTVPASPEPTASYAATAERLGYGTDTARMCVEHELVHNWLCHVIGLPHSPALFAVAHRGDADWRHALEEDAVIAVQRLAMAHGVRFMELVKGHSSECQ